MHISKCKLPDCRRKTCTTRCAVRVTVRIQIVHLDNGLLVIVFDRIKTIPTIACHEPPYFASNVSLMSWAADCNKNTSIRNGSRSPAIPIDNYPRQLYFSFAYPLPIFLPSIQPGARLTRFQLWTTLMAHTTTNLIVIRMRMACTADDRDRVLLQRRGHVTMLQEDAPVFG
jgi:hypothetical protein